MCVSACVKGIHIRYPITNFNCRLLASNTNHSTLLDIFSKQTRSSKLILSSLDVLISLQLSTELSISSISISSSSSVPISLVELALNCNLPGFVSLTDCLANIFDISEVIGSLEANASKTDNAATRTVGSVICDAVCV